MPHILVILPPPVQGLGNHGRLQVVLSAGPGGGRGYDDLAKVTADILNSRAAAEGIVRTRHPYHDLPRMACRSCTRTSIASRRSARASRYRISSAPCRPTLGSTYVNDFITNNKFRPYVSPVLRPGRGPIQARIREDVAISLKDPRNASGAMVPIGSILHHQVRPRDPTRVAHYQRLPSHPISTARPRRAISSVPRPLQRWSACPRPHCPTATALSGRSSDLPNRSPAANAAVLVFPLCVLLVF